MEAGPSSDRFFQFTSTEIPRNVEALSAKYILSAFRKVIIELACRLENEDCFVDMRAWFQAWKTGQAEITPDLRYVVYCYGVRHGHEADWLYLYERQKVKQEALNLREDWQEAQKALGCSKDTGLLRRYLRKELGREKDTYLFEYGLTLTPEGRRAIWEEYQDKSGDYHGTYSSDNVIKGLVSESDTREVEEYMTKIRSHQRFYLNKTISESRMWVAQNLQPIHNWLLARELKGH
ncbi:hypothetical protein CAPTEDRAFT_209001 [Capitella teleta]|uniref:ERAP1-like C-terminal domain-containing protein n=1 Tax=Capitella teleta TaxID=283909 RepID=R7U620_CAPTE|nr:hypothetical protein CAPTEDRAFT_209001 [Capitella teleta]|eukprot:ELU01536.1 hypothetical protein CAPTEDRAFT_209001 [Capitella teleta]